LKNKGKGGKKTSNQLGKSTEKKRRVVVSKPKDLAHTNTGTGKNHKNDGTALYSLGWENQGTQNIPDPGADSNKVHRKLSKSKEDAAKRRNPRGVP